MTDRGPPVLLNGQVVVVEQVPMAGLARRYRQSAGQAARAGLELAPLPTSTPLFAGVLVGHLVG